MKVNLSRRKFLLGSLSILALAIGGVLVLNFRTDCKHRIKDGHIPGVQDPTEFPPKILENISLFLTTMFGLDLQLSENKELIERLEFAVKFDNGWRNEYQWLSNELNRVAIKSTKDNFMNLSFNQRIDVVNDVFTLTPKPWTKKSRILALISDSEINHRRFWNSTLPHLKWLYINSGMQWKVRGYSSWPGVSGDNQEYIKKGRDYIC